MAYDDKLINYTRKETKLYIYIYILLHLRTVTIGVAVGLGDCPRLVPDDGSADDGLIVGLWVGSRAAGGVRNRNSYL